MANYVATEILKQLGGGRFIAMTGSKEFVGSEKGLFFKVGRNEAKVTHCSIKLNAFDTYDVEFTKWDGKKMVHNVKAKHEGIFCDMLQTIFTQETKLFTRM